LVDLGVEKERGQIELFAPGDVSDEGNRQRIGRGKEMDSISPRA